MRGRDEKAKSKSEYRENKKSGLESKGDKPPTGARAREEKVRARDEKAQAK